MPLTTRAAALLAVATPLVVSWVCAACSTTNADPTRGAGRDEAGVDGGGVEASAPAPEALFRALEADLVRTCGGNAGACHVNGAVGGAGKWLGPPDAYKSAKAWRGVIPDDNILEHGILLTQIEHTGPSLTASPALYAKVKEWVAAEIVGTRLPGSEPFAVQVGANTVDLTKATPGAIGAVVRFDAAVAGEILTLTNIRITGANLLGLHVESPFFAILPENGPVISDTTNGFEGTLDLRPAETQPLFGGALVIPKWKAATRLQLFFRKLVAAPELDAGATGACKSVATFTSSAVPAFRLDLGGGLTCLGCHGGANDVATNAMDLSAVGTDDPRACAQARNHVDFGDKQKSPILATPTGAPNGNPNHAVRDAGAAFVSGVLGWITNE